MTKPPLGKVEALLYVLQHVTTRGCARILTHPLFVCFVLCVFSFLFRSIPHPSHSHIKPVYKRELDNILLT